MKKILFLVPHLSTGGMPQYTLSLIKSLINDCEIYCMEYAMVSWDYVVQRNQIQDILGDKFFSIGANKDEFIKVINQINPDIVHLQEVPEYFMSNEIADELYKKDRNYKIVETSHDSSFDVGSKRYYPDHFALISEFQRNNFNKLKIPIDLIEADIEYKPRQNREEGLLKLGLDPTIKHVLNVGLFTARKNQAEIFKYAKMMIDEPIQFHFVGNQADNFKNYWEPLLQDIPPNVKIWGERSDVGNFYSCMDLFLFTSRGFNNDKETSPLVIRESIGYNIPALIYNLPVYLNMYDKYETINYLDENSLENNVNKIKEILSMERIDKKPMKIATIIDAYISSKEKEQLLINCIESVKNLGHSIILVSHCPIADNIVKMVDYHIYDKDNEFSDNHVYGFKIKDGIEARVNINKSHEYPIVSAIRSSVSFADALGYDFFYFTEFDHKYAESDINKVKEMENRLVNENKDFIIFQPVDAVFGDIKGVYYDTCFFGAKTKEFLNVFNNYFPKDLKTYNELFAVRFPNCLEHFFYEAFSPYVDKMILTENYVKLALIDSEINTSSYQNTKCLILPSDSGNHYLYIANENTVDYTFKVYFDGNIQSEFSMKNGFLVGNFELIPLKKTCDIMVAIYRDEQLVRTELIKYDVNKSDEYIKNGKLIFRKGEPNTKLMSVELEYDTNKVSFTAIDNIVAKTIVSIKDIDSKACIYSFELNGLPKGYNIWAIPTPTHITSFKNNINFGGLLIEYYQDGEIVDTDEIRIKDIPILKPIANLSDTEPIFNNYTEFFVQRIYEGLDLDGCKNVIDAGANVGLWTKYILTRMPKRVYCFEPNLKALDNLRNNMKDEKNVTIVPKAIGTENGKIKFYADENSLISSIYPTGNNIEYEVDCVTFDSFLEEHGLDKIDLFKLDIEGAEFPILRSFGKDQFDKIDAFLIEYHEWNGGTKQELIDKLESNGYLIQEVPGSMFIFAYKQKKSYLIPPSTHFDHTQKNVSFLRVNLYESSKGFNWEDLNLGKHFTFDHMYGEMYREFNYNDTGCCYERFGCVLEKGDIVVDVGANIGMFSNLAFERRASKIYAFEPTDIAYACLLQNKPRNCETFKMAISDTESLFDIVLPSPMDPMGAGIYKDKSIHSESNKVLSTTIDRLFSLGLFEKIDFLKIDAEGAELSIIKGISDENLSKIRKISMEFHLNDLGETASDYIWNRLVNSGFKAFNLIYGTGELRIYSFWRE